MMLPLTARRQTQVGLLVLSMLWSACVLGAVARPDEDNSSAIRSALAEAGVFSDLGVVAEGAAIEGVSLGNYIVSALNRNQRLKRSYSEYVAANEMIGTATSLPDPKLGYSEYLNQVETRVGPQERAFSLSQSFPWFGSLSLQGEVKRESAEAARANFLNVALETIAEVKKAYFEIGYVARAISVTEQHVNLLTQWESVAQFRYSAGAGKYADIIKAQVELGVLLDRLAQLNDQRRPLEVALNAILDRDPLTPVDVETMPAPVESIPDLIELAGQMRARNPQLKVWEHRAQEALKTNQLVKKQGHPSFTVGLNYILTGPARMGDVVDSGKDAVVATVGLSLPVWRGKYNAASRAAASRYEASVSARRDLANSLQASLERELYRYRDAVRKLNLYRSTLLPKGRQSLGAIRSSYEAGDSSFLDLMDAERLVLEFELSLVRAEFDALTQQAVIEEIVAGPISRAESATK